MIDPVWVPGPRQLEKSQITRFGDWVERRRGVVGHDYQSLWSWSVERPDEFWADIASYFAVEFTDPPSSILGDRAMPGASWFPGATLNYTNSVLRHRAADRTAIIGVGEDTPTTRITWSELYRQVAGLSHTLRRLGVERGDRVVGYVPDIAEAVIAFLATASLGATWAACGQEYPADAAIDRLGQLAPTVLVAADGYRYGGRVYDKTEAVRTLRTGLPTLRAVIGIERVGIGVPESLSWRESTAGEYELHCEPVAFDHPLWVLFSSGTTGAPKGIVHGHGGIVLEHLKHHALHLDIGERDCFFWFTSPSWTMWNMQVSGLLLGASIVCYDGSPTHPAPGTLWRLSEELSVTVLGISPAYLGVSRQAGVDPSVSYDLAELRIVGSTGAVLPKEAYYWVRDHVGADVMLASLSGGTDVCSAFAGCAPNVPVWPGEMSVRALGVALAAFGARHEAVTDEVGELVVTQPMPSMPVRFWDDPSGERYRNAYFDDIPDVWRHGDWITLTARGTVLVHGRSDATLNRNGIRMGSAEIYRALEAVPEVLDSLVLGVEESDGKYWMPLFVVLPDDVELDTGLAERIRKAIAERSSPRHVPDDIRAAPGIPYTRTGKKLEIPVKRLLQGASVDEINRATITRPELLTWFKMQRRRSPDVTDVPGAADPSPAFAQQKG